MLFGSVIFSVLPQMRKSNWNLSNRRDPHISTSMRNIWGACPSIKVFVCVSWSSSRGMWFFVQTGSELHCLVSGWLNFLSFMVSGSRGVWFLCKQVLNFALSCLRLCKFCLKWRPDVSQVGLNVAGQKWETLIPFFSWTTFHVSHQANFPKE
jgi:hypothetical protein